MAKYHVENFGCRSQRADGEAIAADFSRRGLTAAAGAESADVLVVNTCSVTAEADRMARAFLRRMHRKNPEAKIIVTGCYAQRAPEEIAALNGVSAVIGNSHKGLLADVALSPAAAAFVPLDRITAAGPSTIPILADDSFAHSDVAMPGLDLSTQTRPNLKVQDGCSNRCSFCIIPTTRGASRSRSLEEALDQVRGFVAEGGYELVLSGINLGRWGRDLEPRMSLEDLVAAILVQTELPRLRLSSIEPMDWSANLLALMAEYATPTKGMRIARHAHLPLQSGCDAILRAMHRRYRPWHYASKIEEIAKRIPGVAIGADFMVGFPGETEAQFQESYDFVASLPFTYLHLFPFSARPGTKAWQLHKEKPVAHSVVQQRMAALRQLMAAKNKAFREGFLGQEIDCLTLHTRRETAELGRTEALTDNFVRVDIDGELSANRLIRVRIQGITEEGISGVQSSF